MATAAGGGAPAPAGWTGAAIAAWLSVPYHWSFIVLGLAAGAGSFFGLRSWLEDPAPAAAKDEDLKRVLAELEILKERLGSDPKIPRAATEAFAETAEGLARSGNALDRSVAREVVEGDPIDAADRLMSEVGAGRHRNAERARQAARLYAPFAPSKAMAAYREAVDLDPADVWSWIGLGRLTRHFGTLADARACFSSALQHVGHERDRMVLYSEFANLLLVEGELPEARTEYEAAHAIAERLARQEPANTQWQRDLSISFNRLGDVEVSAGNLGAARDRFEAALAIAERLARQEPANSQWQRDLSVSFNRLGDVEVSAGNLVAARERFEAGLAIAERLARQEPANTEWQRDLSVSVQRLGDVEVSAANLVAARERFEAGLAISERLARQEPANTQWQRDLFVSNAKLAQLAEAEGRPTDARERFAAAERIMAALAEMRPEHPGFARDLQQVRADIERLRSQCE